jgi:hypothetical protein
MLIPTKISDTNRIPGVIVFKLCPKQAQIPHQSTHFKFYLALPLTSDPFPGEKKYLTLPY